MNNVACGIGLLFLLGIAASAQIPEGISWQGFLTDEGGPLEGSVDLVISLYDVESGGTALYEKDTTGVQVSEGVVSVPLGPFSGVSFEGPLFVGVTVDGGNELVPRSPLLSVPFAHRAIALPGMRTEPVVSGPDEGTNVIGGASNNTMSPGVVGGTIAGGGGFSSSTSFANAVNGDWGTVAGGRFNRAGDFATVGGGASNYASGFVATIAGGSVNAAGGQWATVVGGRQNEAGADFATVAGGINNEALGIASFAAGFRATAAHDGSFVWADYTDADFSSDLPNRFAIRAANGVLISNSGSGATLLELGMERPWKLGQFSSGSGAALELATLAADGTRNFLITTPGNVGIGTTNPTSKLEVNGDIEAAAFNPLSDARMKTGVTSIVDPLEKVRQLSGVYYRWDREAHPERTFDEGRRIGFLAQEVAPVVPEVVKEGADGYLMLEYDQVVALLVEAVKERDRKTEALEQRVADLESMVLSLAEAR